MVREVIGFQTDKHMNGNVGRITLSRKLFNLEKARCVANLESVSGPDGSVSFDEFMTFVELSTNETKVDVSNLTPLEQIQLVSYFNFAKCSEKQQCQGADSGIQLSNFTDNALIDLCDNIEEWTRVKITTSSPSANPTQSLSHLPSNTPSIRSSNPSASPTNSPTTLSSHFPSNSPSATASQSPSHSPSTYPSKSPTRNPSQSPTKVSSDTPTEAHSRLPSSSPSTSPSRTPSEIHSRLPSSSPSASPTRTPTENPSQTPTKVSSDTPTVTASQSPSQSPSTYPSKSPTKRPSQSPTKVPSDTPTEAHSRLPSSSPSTSPSRTPSEIHSRLPSSSPSASPTKVSSKTPTETHSRLPSTTPSMTPTKLHSGNPSKSPTSTPSINAQPTEFPTMSGVLTRVPYSYSLSYDNTQTNETALQIFLGGLNTATEIIIKDSLTCNSNNSKRILRMNKEQQQILETFQSNLIQKDIKRERHTHSQFQSDRRMIECNDNYRVQSRFQNILYDDCLGNTNPNIKCVFIDSLIDVALDSNETEQTTLRSHVSFTMRQAVRSGRLFQLAIDMQ